MKTHADQPFYQKFSFILISITLICVGLHFGKHIILPVLFAILLGNILLPFTHYLSRRKFNKPLSIFIPLLLSIIISGGVLYILSSQVMNFIDDIPTLKERVNEVSHSVQVW